MNENENRNECNCENKSSKIGWQLAQIALLLITVFLAAYLAVYYVLDQIRHTYYLPTTPLENIDKIIREQDKLFNNATALPMHNSTQTLTNSPIETIKDEKTNSYKMIIDLKPFNNDPKNIEISINDNKINVKGLTEKTNKNSEKIYAFSQSYILPDNIDEDKVTKEKIKNKYIITMPIDNLD